MSITAAPEQTFVRVPPSGSFRLALVASHPVQYQAPWYRALAALLKLKVFSRIGSARPTMRAPDSTSDSVGHPIARGIFL